MKRQMSLVALAAAVALASCAGQQQQPTPPPPREAQESTAAPKEAETSKLHGLNHQQRVEFMKTEVMPKITPVFKGFDAEHFAEVTCVTCHGPGAKQDMFDMPTASLPRLDFAKKDPEHEQWNAFMRTEVVPTMATVLGVKPYDKATGEGFGCLDCHLEVAKQGG